MKVLMVEPGKSPYETEIEGGLESLQAAVGGDIQATYPFDDLVGLICNDEGKLIGLPLNRALYDDEGHLYDIVPGNFLIIGLGEEDFTDLPADLIEKYTERFKYPEKFFRLAGEIVAVKQPLPPEEKQQPASVMEEPGRDDIRLDDTTDLAFDLDEFFRQNSGAYADLYPDSHAEKERMADELLSGDTGKIRMRLAAFEREEHMEGETAPLLARISSYEKEYGISTYSIYQLGLSDNTDNLRFMSLDWLESKGFSVDRDHYQMVYARQREPGETLEDIYRRFNIDHPEDSGATPFPFPMWWSCMRMARTPHITWTVSASRSCRASLTQGHRRPGGMFRCGNSLTMQGNRQRRQSRKRRIKGPESRKGADSLC